MASQNTAHLILLVKRSAPLFKTVTGFILISVFPI